MLFNTIDFIIFFVFVLATIIAIKNKKFQHIFILGASYFFFYYTSNYLITLLIFSTLLDYFVGNQIWKTEILSRKKILLALSLIGNLSLLGFFKYTDFAITEFNELFRTVGIGEISLLEIALPVGISFYTFQSMSYTLDIYYGRLKPSKSLGEFALFVAFFPQLVAGPILRASNFLPQLREKISEINSNMNLKQILIHNANLKLGVTIMAFGFFKKMFFADNLAPFVDELFFNPIGLESFAIILGTIGFGIQLYCDFSGYSDIAIGAALILGFKIPANFNFPFFATSPTEFWRRWHISLSTWVRDYLFYPMVFSDKTSKMRIFVSLFATLFLIGIWHGAGWNFVIYGIIHGFYVSIDSTIRNKFPSITSNIFFRSKIGKIISILATQYLIFLSFLSFRIHDLEHLTYSIQKFVIFDFQMNGIDSFVLEHKLPISLIVLFVILHFISYNNSNLRQRIADLKLRYWAIFLTIIMIAIIFFYDANPRDFIYFKF